MVGLVPGSGKEEALETQSELKIDPGKIEQNEVAGENVITTGISLTACEFMAMPCRKISDQLQLASSS